MPRRPRDESFEVTAARLNSDPTKPMKAFRDPETGAEVYTHKTAEEIEHLKGVKKKQNAIKRKEAAAKKKERERKKKLAADLVRTWDDVEAEYAVPAVTPSADEPPRKE
jgi:hypothetical protein